MTRGFSRDDVEAAFFPAYLTQGILSVSRAPRSALPSQPTDQEATDTMTSRTGASACARDLRPYSDIQRGDTILGRTPLRCRRYELSR